MRGKPTKNLTLFVGKPLSHSLSLVHLPMAETAPSRDATLFLEMVKEVDCTVCARRVFSEAPNLCWVGADGPLQPVKICTECLVADGMAEGSALHIRWAETAVSHSRCLCCGNIALGQGWFSSDPLPNHPVGFVVCTNCLRRSQEPSQDSTRRTPQATAPPLQAAPAVSVPDTLQQKMFVLMPNNRGSYGNGEHVFCDVCTRTIPGSSHRWHCDSPVAGTVGGTDLCTGCFEPSASTPLGTMLTLEYSPSDVSGSRTCSRCRSTTAPAFWTPLDTSLLATRISSLCCSCLQPPRTSLESPISTLGDGNENLSPSSSPATQVDGGESKEDGWFSAPSAGSYCESSGETKGEEAEFLVEFILLNNLPASYAKHGFAFCDICKDRILSGNTFWHSDAMVLPDATEVDVCSFCLSSLEALPGFSCTFRFYRTGSVSLRRTAPRCSRCSQRPGKGYWQATFAAQPPGTGRLPTVFCDTCLAPPESAPPTRGRGLAPNLSVIPAGIMTEKRVFYLRTTLPASYGSFTRVYCDSCNGDLRTSEFFWHCPPAPGQGRSGQDLCPVCLPTKVRKSRVRLALQYFPGSCTRSVSCSKCQQLIDSEVWESMGLLPEERGFRRFCKMCLSPPSSPRSLIRAMPDRARESMERTLCLQAGLPPSTGWRDCDVCRTRLSALDQFWHCDLPVFGRYGSLDICTTCIPSRGSQVGQPLSFRFKAGDPRSPSLCSRCGRHVVGRHWSSSNPRFGRSGGVDYCTTCLPPPSSETPITWPRPPSLWRTGIPLVLTSHEHLGYVGNCDVCKLRFSPSASMYHSSFALPDGSAGLDICLPCLGPALPTAKPPALILAVVLTNDEGEEERSTCLRCSGRCDKGLWTVMGGRPAVLCSDCLTIPHDYELPAPPSKEISSAPRHTSISHVIRRRAGPSSSRDQGASGGEGEGGGGGGGGRSVRAVRLEGPLLRASDSSTDRRSTTRSPSIGTGEQDQEDSSTSERLSRECAICLSSEADYVVLPCGHLALCGLCSQQVASCPICRENIESRHRVFL